MKAYRDFSERQKQELTWFLTGQMGKEVTEDTPAAIREKICEIKRAMDKAYEVADEKGMTGFENYARGKQHEASLRGGNPAWKEQAYMEWRACLKVDELYYNPPVLSETHQIHDRVRGVPHIFRLIDRRGARSTSAPAEEFAKAASQLIEADPLRYQFKKLGRDTRYPNALKEDLAEKFNVSTSTVRRKLEESNFWMPKKLCHRLRRR